MTIETAFSIELPVGEKLTIKRTRFTSAKKTSAGRISIMTGLHGDELEGQYVAWLLTHYLEKHSAAIHGTIDVYPALNPTGIDSIVRKVPPYNVDLNRAFPGSPDSILPFRLAHGITEAVEGSDWAVDIHASNIFLREVPQIRIAEATRDALVPLAKLMNIDFVWIHEAVTVLESTCAHALNAMGTKTLVVEMGVGMRITKSYGHQLFDGIVNMLVTLGLLDVPAPEHIRTPTVSTDGTVHFLNAESPGIFIPAIEHNTCVSKDQPVGTIVDTFTGEILSTVVSPADGFVFTLREYPVVYEGSLMARIYEEKPA